MCKCTLGVKSPYCGKPGCEWPFTSTEKQPGRFARPALSIAVARAAGWRAVKDESVPALWNLYRPERTWAGCGGTETDVWDNVPDYAGNADACLSLQARERIGVSFYKAGYEGKAKQPFTRASCEYDGLTGVAPCIAHVVLPGITPEIIRTAIYRAFVMAHEEHLKARQEQESEDSQRARSEVNV